MTLADDTEAPQVPGTRTLSVRRPGHAVMTKALVEVGPAAQTQVAAQMPVASRSWYDGAVGELIVGHELAGLPCSWRVLHAVPIGRKGRDIDHLVIGPGGIFVLNTKRHLEARIRAGTFVTWVRDAQHRYQAEIVEVTHEVKRALAAALPKGTTPTSVLVFVQSESFTQVGEQRVAALRSDDLVAYLLSQPQLLSADEIDSISLLAEKPETWGAPSDVLDEPDPTVRFLGLRPPIGQFAPSPQSPARSLPAQRRAPRRQAPPNRPTPRRTRAVSKKPATLPQLLSALLMIPVTIGLFEVVVKIGTGLLTGR